MKRRSYRGKFALKPAEHAFAAKKETEDLNRVIGMAERSYEADDCLKAGQQIDAAYVSVGRVEAHIGSLPGHYEEGAFTRLTEAEDRLHAIDRKFERTCVRKRPNKDD